MRSSVGGDACLASGSGRHKVKGPKTPPPVPERIAPRPPGPGGLRVAFLVYRGNPRCGGQGVYTRHLTRELDRPGPLGGGLRRPAVAGGGRGRRLHPGPQPRPLPRAGPLPDPPAPRVPHRPSTPWSSASCARPASPSRGPSACGPAEILAGRRDDFDLVHDNQCLGDGILGMLDDGWPLLETLHHPITVDRQLALAHATNPWQNVTQRRWFGFLRMQVRVARALPRVVTVSESSKTDIAAQMGVDAERMTVVPVGVDHTVFRPRPEVHPGPRPDHGHLVVRRADEGPGAPARGGGQAAHRAGDRAGGDRQPPTRGPGGQGHRAPRPGPGGPVRLGHHRRRAGRQLRPGPGGGGPLAVRGLLAAGHRGDGVRSGPGRHHRRRPSRGGGHRRGDRPAGPAGRPGRPGRRHRAAARRRRAPRAPGGGRAPAGARALHLAGDGGRDGRAVPGAPGRPTGGRRTRLLHRRRRPDVDPGPLDRAGTLAC